MRLLLDSVVAHARLDLLVGHLGAQLVVAGQLVGGDPLVGQLEGGVEGDLIPDSRLLALGWVDLRAEEGGKGLRLFSWGPGASAFNLHDGFCKLQHLQVDQLLREVAGQGLDSGGQLQKRLCLLFF